MQRVAILVGPKSSGSNMAALIEASRQAGSIYEVGCVIAPQPESPAAALAIAMGVSVHVVPPSDDPLPYLNALGEHEIEWICLAGYLRLLPVEVLRRFPGRVLNIHPALLPKFGGKGMYGRHVHAAVLAAEEPETGCTVHHVSEQYDEGGIVAQLKCAVEPGDTPESLAARVLRLEHQLYPRALSELIVEHETRRSHA